MNQPTSCPQDSLKGIRERNREFYSDPRGMGALKDLQQTFPNPWLYVAELLQNAIDEKPTRIHAKVEQDGAFIFEHNGASFSNQNVESLCMRGVSTKGAGTVGFMGIGFKSVFRSFERAEISSGIWHFTLSVAITKGQRFGDNQREWLGAVLPEWDDLVASPSAGMTCRFRLCRRLPDLPPTADDLGRVLGADETLLALLAWQGVEELDWNGKKWILEKKEFPFSNGAGNRVELASHDGVGATLRRWVLFSRTYKPSDRAIARFLEHRQLRVYEEASVARRVAVFCEIDDAGTPTPVERGSAFALLPTGVTFPIGLHVQADWLLVITRRELMQIEGNKWHEEILDQIPQLLRDFLAWLVESPWPEGKGRNRGYDVLPGNLGGERETDKWFKSDRFLPALANALADLAFLPVPPGKNEPISFITPKQGLQLPESLADLFKEDQSSHRILFGDQTFSRTLLGDRALRCLNKLALLKELSSAYLEERWSQGTIIEWLNRLKESERALALAKLLEALAKLDSDEAWEIAKLPCLPSEGGGWITREIAKRYPSDWGVLSQEEGIQEAFAPLIGKETEIIRWSFDRYLQRRDSPGSDYLEPITQTELEDLAEEWWSSLPKKPTDSEVGLVLRFTCWVRAKQPQRRTLIRKLLSEDSDNLTSLLPTPEVLIADPYADSCRRMWFSNVSVAAPEYIAADPEASPSDWHSFFESLSPPPQGRFALSLTATTLSGLELRKLMGEDPPSRRSSYATVPWRGLSLSSNEYKLLDAHLPEPLKRRFADSIPLTYDESQAIGTWIAESPGMLKEYSCCKIAYIPYGLGSFFEKNLHRDASWKGNLQEHPWVFASGGDGPFCPHDVLPVYDRARPEAPVADLPSDLIEMLQAAGIEFGDRIPDAPATLRLKVQGASAPILDLLELLRRAIEEVVKNPEKKGFLEETLRSTNLFPLPPGRESPDRLTRVPLGRVVKIERGRSTFGWWLTSVESFADQTSERQIFELATSIISVPASTTGKQALDFLSWVWAGKPDADRVRSLLPRAYQYVREDFNDDLKNRINVLRNSAVVFVQGKKWMPVTDDRVFFNDLAEGLPLPDTVLLATPGHLGEALIDQVAVASMLGLKLLSSRFHIDTVVVGPMQVPDHWQQNFAKAQQEFLDRLSRADSDESDNENIRDRRAFTLSRWKQIDTIVFDRGVELQRSPRQAAISGGSIAVAGEPEAFADALCQILFNIWGLRLRRDLVDLIPKVAIQLSRLGDPQLLRETTKDAEVAARGGLSSAERTVGKVSVDNERHADADEPAKIISEPDSPAENSSVKSVKASERDDNVGSSDKITPGGVPARGYTASVRESMIRSLQEKRRLIDNQLTALISTGVLPLAADSSDIDAQPKQPFQSDERFRDAVMKHEQEHGRIPQQKSETQEGHDIDSFICEGGGVEPKLVRRIEVKGKGVPWKAEQIVELSDRQYADAYTCKVEAGVSLHDDFDYWLYIVEDDSTGKLNILPIRNPAKRAGHYEFRAGTWRHLAERSVEE